MLFSGLALIVTIMINTLILHQSSEAGIIPGKGQPNFYPQEVWKRFNYLDANEKTERLPGKNGRTNKTTRMRQRKWYLDPVMLQLSIAIDNYAGKTNPIETIYSGVIGCGLDKCGKFPGLIPENQLMGRVRRFRHNFTISNTLLKFHRGVEIIEETFRKLIYFEESSRFCNSSRRNFLKEIEIGIIMLNLEIKTVMTNKRLNCSQQPKTFEPFSLPHPDNETHLIINEWRIIQDSKRFLREWQENFKKIFKCWKKRQKRRKRKTLLLKSESTPHPPQSTHTNSPKSEGEGKHGTILSGTTERVSRIFLWDKY